MRIIQVVFLLMFIGCSNPLGGSSQIDSTFSPGGDVQTPTPPTSLTTSGDPTFEKSPSLTWIASTDNNTVSHYLVGVGTSISDDNVMPFRNIGNVTSYQFTDINPDMDVNTTYYLLVKAVDSSGNESDISASSGFSPGLVTVSGAYQLPESPYYLSTCADYLSNDYYNNNGDGNYWLDVDGPGGISPFLASCDMATDSGGWILVLNYVHAGGTAPALNVKTLNLPLKNSSTLGNNESSSTTYWGHASNSFLNNISFSQIRYYCVIGSHARVINFKTSLAGAISYIKTGTGTHSGLQASFTSLTGHTGNLPGAATGFTANATENALTNFPFMLGGSFHWGISASGRWECDDFNGGSGQNTIHRVWVR